MMTLTEELNRGTDSFDPGLHLVGELVARGDTEVEALLLELVI